MDKLGYRLLTGESRISAGDTSLVSGLVQMGYNVVTRTGSMRSRSRYSKILEMTEVRVIPLQLPGRSGSFPLPL